jgi:hypothetical protein
VLSLKLVLGPFTLESRRCNHIYQSVCVFACRKLERAVYRLIITNVSLAAPPTILSSLLRKRYKRITFCVRLHLSVCTVLGHKNLGT